MFESVIMAFFINELTKIIVKKEIMESGKFLNIDFSSFLSCILKICLLCKNPVDILKLDVMIILL